MFEFFIALFGGIFWGVKICSDISKTKAYDRNVKIVKQAYENGVAKWEAAVVDSYLTSFKMRLFCMPQSKRWKKCWGANISRFFQSPKKMQRDTFLLSKES